MEKPSNHLIFNNKTFQPNQIIRNSLAESVELHFLSSHPHSPHSSVTSYISWTKPDPPFLKLNWDGSGKDNLLGASGIIRDYNGI